MKKKILLLSIVCFSLQAFESGALDHFFGKKGIVTTLVGEQSSASSMAITQNGKIVITGVAKIKGQQECIVVCYNHDGIPDTTFGKDGVVSAPIGDASNGSSIVVQENGKITISGTGVFEHNQIIILRYNPDGSLDKTFAGCGITSLENHNAQAQGIIIQSDNKLVISGSVQEKTSELALIRYHPNGELDKAFGLDGVVTTSGKDGYCTAVTQQEDGKLVITGCEKKNIVIGRFHTNGMVDELFGSKGFVSTVIGENSEGQSIAIQKDGKIVVAGFANKDKSHLLIGRYHTDGTVDTSFGQKGVVLWALGSDAKASSVILQPNQKIIVAGSATIKNTSCFVVARFNQDGTRDTTFNCSGFACTAIGTKAHCSAMAIQQDKKIVLAGSTSLGSKEIAIARYIGNENILYEISNSILCRVCRDYKTVCAIVKKLFSFC